jgi:excisionase family DNA binding protein
VLITVDEAAKVLGLKSRGSVYRKIKNGELPFVSGDEGKLIERDGLEQVWARINRPKASHPPKLRPAAERTAPRQSSPAPPPPRHTDQPPDYNESRARSEYEKANLLELDRKAKEGLLLHREDVERAQATALAISKTRLLGVPSTAKQRIPHLSLDEVEILTTLIREALDELANWEVEP